MRFSLVMATKARTKEIERFISSLEDQEVGDAELIVVDSNPDDRLSAILESYSGEAEIQRIRFQGGISEARNRGLEEARGEIVAFPDDDCWYPAGVLETANRRFEEDPRLDGLTGRAITGTGEPTHGQWADQELVVDRFNLWKAAISFTIFLRRRVVEAVGDFDEDLGVGADTPWGSGEEADYLLRALDKGFHIRYDPAITVHHPPSHPLETEGGVEKGRSYAAGSGYVYRKHNLPRRLLLSKSVQSMGGIVLSLARLDTRAARFYYGTLMGRLKGWRAGGS